MHVARICKHAFCSVAFHRHVNFYFIFIICVEWLILKVEEKSDLLFIRMISQWWFCENPEEKIRENRIVCGIRETVPWQKCCLGNECNSLSSVTPYFIQTWNFTLDVAHFLSTFGTNGVSNWFLWKENKWKTVWSLPCKQKVKSKMNIMLVLTFELLNQLMWFEIRDQISSSVNRKLKWMPIVWSHLVIYSLWM